MPTRPELKARTRASIVRAAGSLMDDGGGIDFSVDDLAARAGVSRRTIFNHFASLDDVIAAVGAGAFGTLREALLAADPPAGTPGHEGDPARALAADLGAALRRADLLGPMGSLAHGLGLQASPDADTVPAHQVMLLLKSMSDISEDLAADLRRRHPAASPLDADIAVAQFMGGLVVLLRHWFATTGATSDDGAARVAWNDLIDHLIPGTPARPSEGHHG